MTKTNLNTTCWLTELARKVNKGQLHAINDRLQQGRVNEALSISHRVAPVWARCALTSKAQA